MKTPIAAIALLFTILAAGCGSTHHAATPTSTASTTTRTDPQATLTRAVRTALEENFHLSLYVLWHNHIPTWAVRSTRGSALAGLRDSAAARRKRGIRIRPLKATLLVESIKLDPSYMHATVIAESRQCVRRYDTGRPPGRAVALNEKARFSLRRLGNSQRFIVWEVTLLQ
jgi:hypothetical protein